MPRIEIEQMKLELAGMSAEQGRWLALRLAEALGTAGGFPAAGDIPALRVELSAEPHSEPSLLVRRIVAELLAQLRRVP
jgi:hypothetical protein